MPNLREVLDTYQGYRIYRERGIVYADDITNPNAQTLGPFCCLPDARTALDYARNGQPWYLPLSSDRWP